MASPRLSQLTTSRLADLLEVGVAMLAQHYEGRAYGWREGKISLRHLANEHDVSLTSLYRCLAITSMWMECGRPELLHLGVSHLRELVSLKPEHQQQLVLRAEAEKWTVSAVRAARKRHTRSGSVRPGRTESVGTPLADLIDRWTGEVEIVGRQVREIHRWTSAQKAENQRKVQRLQMELEMLEYRLR